MLTTRSLTPNNLRELWKIGFTETDPQWKKWDAPYFENYRPMTYEMFEQQLGEWLLSERVTGIFLHDSVIGIATRHWENEATRWLEIGIILYQPENWSGGLGTQALTQWINQIFERYPNLEHIGLTTWSGNERMMKLAEKIGMQQEACIRKVRYWQGTYYDSMKYGVLRDEWKQINRSY